MLSPSPSLASPCRRDVVGQSLSRGRKGVERGANARMRRRRGPAEIPERGLKVAQIGEDVGFADRPHRPDADNLAGLARVPRACDYRGISLTKFVARECA